MKPIVAAFESQVAHGHASLLDHESLKYITPTTPSALNDQGIKCVDGTLHCSIRQCGSILWKRWPFLTI